MYLDSRLSHLFLAFISQLFPIFAALLMRTILLPVIHGWESVDESQLQELLLPWR